MTEQTPLLLDSHALAVASDRAAYPLSANSAPVSDAERMCERDCERLLMDLAALGGNELVLVQRNRYYGYDNRYISDAAAAHAIRVRAVCAVDSFAADCGLEARRWLSRPGVAGIRFMEPFKGAPFNWLEGAYARDAWRAAVELGALVQVHFFPWARTEGIKKVHALLAEFPVRAVIMDNLTNIDMSDDTNDYGMDEAFRSLLNHPAVHFRFTTLGLHKCTATRVDPAAAIRAIAGQCGAERLLWGSDILPPGLNYVDAVRLGREAVALLSTAAGADILCTTAQRLFFADARCATTSSNTGEHA